MSKEDTKWRLRDVEGKEYIIIDSEKVDLQEELNKTIVKQMKEIERLNKKLENLEELNNANYQSFIEVNNIINELEKKLLELRLTDVDGKTIVYRLLDKLQELKGSNKENV